MTEWLLDTMIATGALIALVLLVRRPVAKLFGAKLAYALWALPLVRLVLPPLVLPAWMAPVEETAAGSGQWTLTIEPAVAHAAETAGAAPMADPVPWGAVALSVWLGGALAFLLWRVWNYRVMRRRLLEDARPVGEVDNIRLVETPEISAPLAFGVLDKVIAMPLEFMGQEDRHARDLAIAHELGHHRGHDVAANMVAQIVLAMHWFNPIAWFGWRAMRRDQEAACDARVIGGCEEAERARYALLIADFAAGSRFALAAPMACPILGEKSIIHRLRSLSMPEISNRRRLLGRTAIGTALLALPMTATISYAKVEEVDVPPSEAAGIDDGASVDSLDPIVKRQVVVVRRDGEDSADGDVEWNVEMDQEVRQAMEDARMQADDARQMAKEMRIEIREARREAAQARVEAEAARKEAMREYRMAFVDQDGVPHAFTAGGKDAEFFDAKEFEQMMQDFEGSMEDIKELEAYFADDGEFAQHMREIERQAREMEKMNFSCEGDQEVTHELSDGRRVTIRCEHKVSQNVQNVRFVVPVRVNVRAVPSVPAVPRVRAVPSAPAAPAAPSAPAVPAVPAVSATPPTPLTPVAMTPMAEGDCPAKASGTAYRTAMASIATGMATALRNS